MKTKTCFKCHETKPIEEFYKHKMMGDGHLGKCKECTKKDVAENYEAKRERYAEYERKRAQDPKRKANQQRYNSRVKDTHSDRYLARMMVRNALKSRRMKRLECEVCGDAITEAHHEDYARPLDVTWLCFTHHMERHGKVAVAKRRFRCQSVTEENMQ